MEVYTYIYDILEKVEISCFTFAKSSFRVLYNDSLTENSPITDSCGVIEITMLDSSNKQINVDRGK